MYWGGEGGGGSDIITENTKIEGNVARETKYID